MRWAVRALVGCAVAGLLASPSAAAELSTPIAEAEAALDAFHAALAAGNRDGALARLAPEVVIFEAGGAELSRDEYAHHHLAGDMEYLKTTATVRIDRRSGASGDFVWVLTRSRVSGTHRGKPVDRAGTESALLVRADGGWRIVHLHWSSRAIQE